MRCRCDVLFVVFSEKKQQEKEIEKYFSHFGFANLTFLQLVFYP